jgi:diguanylate cyclase (GGDEF)-like protein/PAS domain S-box-containing protein
VTTAPSPIGSPNDSGSQRPPRILIVDDEPQVLVALEDALGEEFEVHATDQPAKALRIAQDDPELAVVMSDQRMPGMNGDELLMQIRQSSEATRILCTGYADLQAVVRSVNEGKIFAYVTKPWDGVDLRLKLHHAADHFRLQHELEYEKQLLRDLMMSMPDAIFFKDTEQRYVRVNSAFLQAFGSSEQEVLGRRISDIMPGQSVALEIEAVEREVLESGKPRRDVLHYRLPDGSLRSSSTTRAAVRAPGGKLIGLVGIAQDISDSVRTQEALRQSEERLRLAFLAANAGLFDWNLESSEIVRSSGATLGSSIVDDYASLEQRVHPEDLGRVRQAVQAHLKEHVPLKGLELRARTDDREYRWFEISAQAAWNSAGKPVRLVGATADITERKEHDRRLAYLDHLTRHDEITNLPNRAQLRSELERQLASARANDDELSLVAIDVVRFRHVNETLGPRGGDELLSSIARRIQGALRPGDLAARFDSNSFMIMMTNMGDETTPAQWVSQTLLPALQQPLAVQGTELSISLKAGIALYPSDGRTEDGLIANAEAALKQAKLSAEPYLFYAPKMNSRVAEKVRLETKLRRAIAHDEFLLHYQPKIELRTGRMVGLEALIRWRDPEAGLVSPGAFIPVLEETGLILPAGRWVVERAVQQLDEWLRSGSPVPRVAVNVSPLQLSQRDFIASLDAVLARYPEAGKLLDIELTESVLMLDLEGNIEKLRAIKERGLRVAIDDFGTGYSSLGYLSRLPLDALKVDRSFIENMGEDPQQMSLVTAIISLAHSIGLEVIAEGVETATQAHLLRLLRCDEIQGYLMARPQSAEDVGKLLGHQFEIPRPQKG